MHKNKLGNNNVLPETKNIGVQGSTFLKNQLGIIAKKNFKKNESLFTVKGPIYTKPTKYSLSIGLNKHIEPKRNDGSSDIGHYFNHSCNPNSIIKIVNSRVKNPYIKVLARQNITKGEELTFDYASLEYDITIAKSKCNCNQNNCRKIMSGFKNLPKDIILKYRKEKMIPKYLLDMIDQ